MPTLCHSHASSIVFLDEGRRFNLVVIGLIIDRYQLGGAVVVLLIYNKSIYRM